MSDTFFTKSGSSPGDAGSTRPALRPPQKKSAKRVFIGMAGSPLARVEPVLAPGGDGPEEPPVNKGGRPTLGDRAMTPAERTARSRAMKAEKKADEERRNIAAGLMKKIRRAQPKITDKAFQADKARGENRARLRKLHNDLLLLSVKSLREIAETYELTPDSHGRLHNERSGEASRRYGMSEMERIISAQSTNNGAVTAGGHGPDADEPSEDDNGDSPSFRPPSGPRIPPEHIAYLDKRESIIGELIAQHVRKISLDETDTHHRCLVCGALLKEWSDARQHFWEEYDKGLVLYHKFLDAAGLEKELADETLRAFQSECVTNARQAYLGNKHLMLVWRGAQLKKVS